VSPEIGQVWWMRSNLFAYFRPILILGVYAKFTPDIRHFDVVCLFTGKYDRIAEWMWKDKSFYMLLGERIV
jgi:hypothetical protein